jgi:hypothetical protein
MDKQSAIALGVTAGLGVGYLLGKAQPAALRAARAQLEQKPAKDLDEVERLIRPNILALTPYRCARDDYDQGTHITVLWAAKNHNGCTNMHLVV